MTRPAVGVDRLSEIHDRLMTAVDALTTSDSWRAMLTVAARFHTYSPNNVLLIAAQRPDATRVAGYRAWTQLGRQVRKGERGIAILAPVLRRRTDDESTRDDNAAAAAEAPTRLLRGFRVTHVFDISQTDGPDLPDVRPATLDGVAPLGLWADLLDQVEAAGYTFGYADLAPANGRTDFTDRSVLMHRDLPAAQKVKTLAHELAHVQLHAPDTRPEGCHRPRAEVEAESVAYVVTAAHGLASDDYTVPYVTGWAGGDRELVASTATRVLSCARSILHHAAPPSAQPDPVGTLERVRAVAVAPASAPLAAAPLAPVLPLRVAQR